MIQSVDRAIRVLTALQGARRMTLSELAARLPAGDPVPMIELGHAFELSHHYDEALVAYDDAGSIAPASPVGPREGGLRCAHWGEVQEAQPRLEEAVRRGAVDAETFHALGLVRVHMGDYDGAAEAYRAGIRADPDQVESWIGLATVAVARDDGAGALEAYDAILARHPAFASAHLGRAWALARLGRVAEARKVLDTAEQLGAPRANVARQRAAMDAPVGMH